MEGSLMKLARVSPVAALHWRNWHPKEDLVFKYGKYVDNDSGLFIA